MLKLYDQKTEYRVNPIGLDVPQPAFSWKLKPDKKGVRQDSCRITVFEGEACVFNLFEMNSLNQYGFATIGDWLVKELAGSGFIRTFVANMTIVEIKTTMPRSFVPQYAVDLFEEMIALLNRQAKEENK